MAKPSGSPPQQPTGDFDELSQRWRVRRFPDAGCYVATGGQWHLQEGYEVRKAKNKPTITVFVDLARVDEANLSSDFVKPLPNSFKPDGTLLGAAWRPPSPM